MSCACQKGMIVMRKSRDGGFSLIELIIVIAIMAVLVAIIAPNLTRYLGSAKKKTDESNMNTIKKVFEQGCAYTNTEVTAPDSSLNGMWVVLDEGSAYFDSTASNVGQVQDFKKFIADNLGTVPISKVNGKPFKVKITGTTGNRFEVEVARQ